MRFRHIEIFHAVYTCGSISKAAELLNVSQPSVSKVLQHAEIGLGFNLFHRIKGRLVPTNRAEQLFQEVDLLNRQLQSVNRSARNLRSDAAGQIKFASTPAFAFRHVPRLISEFRKSFPEVTFEVQTRHFEGLVEGVIEHHVDLAIGFGEPEDPRIKTLALGSASVVALCPVSTRGGHSGPLSLAALASDDLVGIDKSGPLGERIKHYLEQQQVEVRNVISVQTYFLAAKMVAEGLGTALLDEFSATSLPADSPVKIFDLDPPLSCPMYCFHHSDKPMRGISQSFLEFVVDWSKKTLKQTS